MNVRAVCEAGFTLPLPLAEALPLFTAEGERRWSTPRLSSPGVLVIPMLAHGLVDVLSVVPVPRS